MLSSKLRLAQESGDDTFPLLPGSSTLLGRNPCPKGFLNLRLGRVVLTLIPKIQDDPGTALTLARLVCLQNDPGTIASLQKVGRLAQKRKAVEFLSEANRDRDGNNSGGTVAGVRGKNVVKNVGENAEAEGVEDTNDDVVVLPLR